jgi:hypothetical protein
MAGTGSPSLAKLQAQILQFATTRITPWTTTLKHTADCQAAGSKEYMGPVQACDNSLSNLDSCLW